MNPSELIAIARALADGVISGGAGPASQTELRRAVSCAYYALFHTLAASNADAFAGASPIDRQRWAWQQIYRAADHRPTRNRLTPTSLENRFPVEIHDFGKAFTAAQRARHSADYDPHSQFHATDVADLINRAETAISAFNQTPEDIRRDLTIHILTTVRSD